MTDIDTAATAAAEDFIDRRVLSSWAHRLIGAALALSEARTWAQARFEWTVIGCEDNEWSDEVCVCGYAGIRFLNTVANRVTGATLYPVGRCCVERFDNDEMKAQMKDLRAVATLGRHARAGVLTHESFSRRAIDELHRQGVIGDVDHELLRRGFEVVRRGRGRVDDPELYAGVARIMREAVVPNLIATSADDKMEKGADRV